MSIISDIWLIIKIHKFLEIDNHYNSLNENKEINKIIYFNHNSDKDIQVDNK